MCVQLRTNFQVASIILMNFRRSPKKPTLIKNTCVNSKQIKQPTQSRSLEQRMTLAKISLQAIIEEESNKKLNEKN